MQGMDIKLTHRFYDMSLARWAFTTVKQYTAVLGLLSLFVPAFAVAESVSCAGLFSETFHFDTLQSEKSLRSYIRTYGKVTPKYISVTLANGAKEIIKTPDSLKLKLNPIKNLDIGLMGVLGKVYDLSVDPITKKNKFDFNEVYAKEVTEKTKKELLLAQSQSLTKEFKKVLHEQIRIENLTPDSVFVQINNQRNFESLPSEIVSALRSHFSTMYLHTVSWVYRHSNLERNNILTNAKMMDEIVAYAKDQKVFEFQLLFDQKTWQAKLQILNLRFNEYQMATDPIIKKKLLDEISQPTEPFLPFAGLATATNLRDRSAPIELKRYFANILEDPLSILTLKDKNDFYLRHKLIYRTVELLPQEKELEIHAHTDLHVRMYKKLGFVEAGLINNPKYPDATIYLLKAKRETVLDSLSLILKKYE